MPVGNASSRPPLRGPDEDDLTQRWVMPLGRVAGTRLGLSYSLFIAAAILVVVVLGFGNDDLPRAAAIGTAFWMAGWLAQLLVHFAVTAAHGIPLRQLNVGFLGVESSLRRWSAEATLIVSVSSIAALLLLGCLLRLVEGGFEMPVLSRPSTAPWTPPSIGFASYDSVWRSGAWLCWMQAVFQLYPLPRTLGRQIFASLVSICGRRLDLAVQVMIFRRCLSAVALLTLVLAVFVMSREGSTSWRQWPLLLMLALLLWPTSRAGDVTTVLTAFKSWDEQGGGDSPERTSAGRGWVSRIRSWLRHRRERKRLQRAIELERREAVDAKRVDDILNRLHRDGVDSLSDEDRGILERVSENLRKQRRSDADQ